MSRPLLIVGAGGHARVVARLAILNGWSITAILDRIAPTRDERIESVAVTGPFATASAHLAAGVRHVAIAVGDNDARAQLFAEFTAQGFSPATLLHPTAIVDQSAFVGVGTIVCAGAIVGVGARLGANVIVNTGAIVDHECLIGDHAHLAPGTRLAGRVQVETGAMIGLGSCVREKQRIGARCVIGAGSVVVDDLPAGVVAFGQPARVIRPRPV